MGGTDCPNRRPDTTPPSPISGRTALPRQAWKRLAAQEEPDITSTIINLAPDGNLTQYFRAIRSFPMLGAEEEASLSRRWRDQHDTAAAHQLVLSHLRLVAKMAMRYRGYGLPVADLIGEGNLGLMQAVQRFDPDRGFRLATYAAWWIRAAINEFVLRSWSLVKLGTTAAQKKLFFNLRRLKSRMQAYDSGDLQPEQVASIASALDVPEEDVVTMNRRLGAADTSLNVTIGEDQDSELQDWLVDGQPSPEAAVADREETSRRSSLPDDALQALQARERHILAERRLKDEPTTLEQLAQHYGISRERVRQIEARAFKKEQRAMKTKVAERRAAAQSAASPSLPQQIAA
jgi:RNA polymerase sigma-32 factor